jgi:hypothetical protein
MRLLFIALLGLGIALPALATGSFAQDGPGKSENSNSGQTGQVGNQGNDKDVGNAGGTHKN